jgi:O-Antigen ligase
MRVQSQSGSLRGSPRNAAPRSTGPAGLSPALKLIALTIFLPEELSFSLFGLRLSLIRGVVFFLTPILLVRLGQSVVSGKRRLIPSDIFVLFTGVWMIVASTMLVDLEYALHHSAPLATEFCGSYLASRVLLSQRGDAQFFVNLICWVIGIVALSAIPDVLTARPVTHEFLQQLTGYEFGHQNETRMGIFRAEGLLGHPILLGTTCVIGLLLAVNSSIPAKSLIIIACGLGALLAVSGAPLQAAFVGLCLIAYDRIFPRFRKRWLLLVSVVALAIGVTYASLSSPLTFALQHLMFDTNSYWTRVYQWNTIGLIVANNPWIGIGSDLQDYAQHLSFWIFVTTVDSIWLNQAMIYGFPGSILLGLSMISVVCCRSRGRGVNLTTEESNLATTLGIIIALIIVLGFTVDLWGSTWMFVGLLMGVRAHLADLAHNVSPARLMPKQKSARQISIDPGPQLVTGPR